MGIEVLGPVTVDGSAGALTPRDRSVLAALAMRPGVRLGTDQIIEAIWGGAPPPTATKVVQGCVVRLRRALGARAIETTAGGYRLVVARQEIDAQRFETAVDRARSLLDTGEAERAVYVVTEALGLWRGEPLAELSDWNIARIEASRLEDLRHSAEELRVEGALRSGRHESVLASAQALVREAPWRERRWVLLAMAQYQAGRQSEALATVRQLRRMLKDELGLDPSPEVDSLERAILRQDPAIGAATALAAPSERCPYPGLLAFDLGDSEAFFGREADIQGCLRRLADSPLLAVIGPSGCGKSSLVRAGVAAALVTERRDVRVMTPGRSPMSVLTLLAPRRDSVLVVDQCEELFTLCEDEAERQTFVQRLVERAGTGQVIVSLRADHVTDVSAFPELARLAERGLHLLGAMSAPELRAAIEGPARLAGLVVEPGLVDVLVGEVARQPGSLPLMSHALAQTWKRREGRTLTIAAYHSSGAMQGAVAQSAEQVYERASQDQRAVLRDLMLRLVLPGPVGEPVRSRLPRRLVVTDDAHDSMIDLLVQSRLVTSHDGEVEIAHEALASAWPRLRSWLDDDIEGRRTMHHLAGAADAWDSLGRPVSELYRGVRLARAVQWREQASPALTQTERDFLDASVELSEAELRRAEERAREQARSNRRLRVLLVGLVALLVVAGIATRYAVMEADRSERAAITSAAQRVGSRAMVTQDIGLSILLAVAGVRLSDGNETRANLVTELARFPYLERSSRAAGNYVDVMDVSPDGTRIAAGDDDNAIHLYDSATGRPLSTFTWGSDRPEPAQSEVAFSPTAPVLAVASRGVVAEPVRLLDSRNLRPTGLPLPLPDDPAGDPAGDAAGVRDVSFSADGRYLAASLLPTGDGKDGPDPDTPTTAVVWDLSDPGQDLHASFPVGGDPQRIALSPDGRTLFTSLPAAAYDVSTGDQLWQRPEIGTHFGFDVSPDGSLLVLNHGDFTHRFEMVALDTRTGGTRTVLRGAKDLVRDLRFAHSGDLLAAGTQDGEILLFQIRTGDLEDRWPADETVWSLDFSPDDSLVYAGGLSGMLRTWDHRNGKTLLEQAAAITDRHYVFADISHDTHHVAFRWNERGKLWRGWLSFLDLRTGATTRPVREPVDQTPWVASSWTQDDEGYAAYAACNSTCPHVGTTVSLFDPHTGQIMRSRDVMPSVIFGVRHTEDDSVLLVADFNGSIAQVDAETLEPAAPTLDAEIDCCMADVPGTGRLFYLNASAGGAYEEWHVVDRATGEEIIGGDLPTRGLDSALSPDGREAAVPERSGELAKIDLATGDQVHGSTGFTVDLERVAYSEDGTRIVTGAADGAVSLWDADSLDLLGTVVPPSRHETVASVRFLPGSHDVVIASHDGRVFLWRVDPERAVSLACQMAGRSLTRDEWRDYLPDQPYREVCPVDGATSGPSQ